MHQVEEVRYREVTEGIPEPPKSGNLFIMCVQEKKKVCVRVCVLGSRLHLLKCKKHEQHVVIYRAGRYDIISIP